MRRRTANILAALWPERGEGVDVVGPAVQKDDDRAVRGTAFFHITDIQKPGIDLLQRLQGCARRERRRPRRAGRTRLRCRGTGQSNLRRGKNRGSAKEMAATIVDLVCHFLAPV